MNDESKQVSGVAVEVALAARAEAHYAVHFANRALLEVPWDDPAFAAARAALDVVMVDLYKAKWNLGRIDRTYTDFADPGPASGLSEVVASFKAVASRCDDIAEACRSREVVSVPDLCLTSDGTEIAFADGVPLVPSICPIVVLTGSNRDMGRQYAQQVIEIYGPWIMQRLASHEVTPAERDELAKWAEQLESAMPEVLEFARGWSEGASEMGVALTEEQAVAIWTGYNPPAENHRMMGADFSADGDQGVAAYLASGPAAATLLELADMCSGACAWGDATADGSLIAGSTTDHDCTYQATIVAFPDSGNNFIYTPFSANGTVPVLQRAFMAGHPGMNDKGLAYVHHGGQTLDGGSSGGGPKDEWGYGVRRGASTFHALQFCDNADSAREMILGLPVGDPGTILGTAGGLYADANYGFVAEERAGSPDRPEPILREASYDAEGGAHAFLYANNNPISPKTGSWESPSQGDYKYAIDAGWYVTTAAETGAMSPALSAARLSSKNSAGRNRYLYRTLMEGEGSIDLDYMQAAYRQGGTVPEGDHAEISARWAAGEEWDCSAAHRGNAFTAVMRPQNGHQGIYRGCIGPAKRSVQTRDPSHGYYYYDETNAFWELTLAGSSIEMMWESEREATRRIEKAELLLATLFADHGMNAALVGLLDKSRSELLIGRQHAQVLDETSTLDDAEMAQLARATRAFTRAQVRAAQVSEMIEPPPHDTRELLKVKEGANLPPR